MWNQNDCNVVALTLIDINLNVQLDIMKIFEY